MGRLQELVELLLAPLPPSFVSDFCFEWAGPSESAVFWNSPSASMIFSISDTIFRD